MANGDDKYVEARQIRHSPIPTWADDCEYMTMLGEAATLGSAKAMSKLGEYALRRGMLVEAHLWVWRARKAGMAGLDHILRTIRRNWKMYGRNTEEGNVYPLFTEDDRSLALSLLDMMCGYNADEARAYLRAHHPEYLP